MASNALSFTVPVIGDGHFRDDARQSDRRASIAQIIRECRSLPVAMWAVPGDLFDSVSGVAERNAWADYLEAMAAIAPVVGCYGNHDRDGDLYLFTKIKAAHPITFCYRPTVLDVPTQYGVLCVSVLPYPHPAGLVGAGVAPADVVSTARAQLDVILMEHGARLQAARADGRPTLMVGHANVSGSKLSTGQPMIGREIELDESMLLRLGDCAKVLNHIHYPQEIGGATLVGSVTAQSWGEVEPKRYVRVDFMGAYPSKQWQWAVQSCPLNTPQLVLVEATFAQMEFTYSTAPSEVPVGSEVRVRVRFPESERDFFEYGRPRVQEAFAHCRRVDIEPICQKDQGLRSPEVAAASTLREKIGAWAKAAGLEVPADVDAAIATLETVPATDVVSTFRRRMVALSQGEDPHAPAAPTTSLPF